MRTRTLSYVMQIIAHTHPHINTPSQRRGFMLNHGSGWSLSCVRVRTSATITDQKNRTQNGRKTCNTFHVPRAHTRTHFRPIMSSTCQRDIEWPSRPDDISSILCVCMLSALACTQSQHVGLSRGARGCNSIRNKCFR